MIINRPGCTFDGYVTLMSRQRCHSGGSGAASKLSSIPSTTSPRLLSRSSSPPPSRFRFLLVAVEATYIATSLLWNSEASPGAPRKA